MGYYTRYDLKIDCDDTNKLVAIKKAMLEIEDYFKYALDFKGEDDSPQNEFGSYEPCKWYYNESTMKTLSAKFPDVLFTLSGEGEESGDIWTAYHKNGKMQRTIAKFTKADFDPEQLM